MSSLKLTPAVGEAVEACAALGAGAADDVVLTCTLTTKLLTQETGRSVRVTVTLHHPVVVGRRQGEDAVTAEPSRGRTETRK